jgi:hypothetical protein
MRAPELSKTGRAISFSLSYMKSPIEVIFSQPLAHLVCYLLTISMLFGAVWLTWIQREINSRLAKERTKLEKGNLSISELTLMIHPVAYGLIKLANTHTTPSLESLRHCLESAEVALFLPLRSAVSLIRDLSTLMGLVSTCVGLVTAAAGFVQHGKPELMIGSIGTAAIGTIIAGVSCMLSLWNHCRLTNIRLKIAKESDELLIDRFESRKQDNGSQATSDARPKDQLEG